MTPFVNLGKWTSFRLLYTGNNPSCSVKCKDLPQQLSHWILLHTVSYQQFKHR
jgi:hypothetical protein